MCADQTKINRRHPVDGRGLNLSLIYIYEEQSESRQKKWKLLADAAEASHSLECHS